MRREACAAETHKAGSAHGFDEIFFAVDFRRFKVEHRVFPVVFNNNRLGNKTARQFHFFYGRHLAGHGRVHRGADILVGVAHDLPDFNRIPHLDGRHARRADVLPHGQSHRFRRGDALHRHVFGVLFVRNHDAASDFFLWLDDFRVHSLSPFFYSKCGYSALYFVKRNCLVASRSFGITALSTEPVSAPATSAQSSSTGR